MPTLKRAPIPPADFEKPDASAIQALERGDATPDQQKRALNWIIFHACQTYDFCTNPESDRLSAIFDGRRYAGLQIIKILKINISKMKDAE